MAVGGAAIEQHLGELHVIACGRYKAAATRNEFGGLEKAAGGGIILHIDTAGAVGLVATGEAMALPVADMKAGVDHAERLEQAIGEEIFELLARNDFDEPAADIGGDRIIPGVAGRKFERQFAQRSDHVGQRAGLFDLADFFAAIGCIDVGAQLKTIGQPGGMAEQIDDLHRAFHRAGLETQLVGAGDKDTNVFPGGNVAMHGVFERDKAFFNQHHQRYRRDRLGHRIDAKNGIGRHGQPAFDIGMAGHAEMRDIAMAGDHRQCAGQFAGGDVFFSQEMIDTGKAIRVETKVIGHVTDPDPCVAGCGWKRW